jgi:CheY-like chemotaxis protein
MSKKTIVLADNSYTIRRIVELSFSEEKEIELVSFENSFNLREKLLELRPQVVMVDIKLPEFNGYEVCKFVQESAGLQHTKVFLLKGGFEPVDENILKSLRYVDIITKPFDSNALVSNIKKLLEEMPDQPAPAGETPAASAASAPVTLDIPSSMPEDVPEIDGLPEPEGDISFSDIKDEIDSDGILAEEDFSAPPSSFPDDEVLPSEEITQMQGSQADRDNLASTPSAEDVNNPFRDDMPEDDSEDSLSDEELNIKRNIALQEKELEIGSLTMEEINIKKVLEEQKARQQSAQMGLDIESDDDNDFGSLPGSSDEINLPSPEEPESDTSELFPNINLEQGDQDSESISDFSAESPEPESSFLSESQKESTGLEDSMFGVSDESDQDGDSDDDKLFSGESDMPEINYESMAENDSPLETPDTMGADLAGMSGMPEMPEMEDEESDAEAMSAGFDGSDEPQATQLPETFVTQKMEVPDFGSPEPPTFEEPGSMMESPETIQFSDFAGTGASQSLSEDDFNDPMPSMQQTQPMPAIPKDPPPSFEEPPAPVETGFDPMAASRQPEPRKAPESTPAAQQAPQPDIQQDANSPGATTLNQSQVMDIVQDRLTHAIKEMLWEIVPPLAEKIIKEEIQSLKAETENAFK